MEIHECVVCGVSIWPTEGYLCFGHRTIRGLLALDTRVMAAVRRIERTYFALGAQQPACQLANRGSKGHWTVELDDILRAYGVHQERPQDGPAGNESEAA